MSHAALMPFSHARSDEKTSQVLLAELIEAETDLRDVFHHVIESVNWSHAHVIALICL